MNNFERFLSFTSEKIVNKEGSLVYRFTGDHYQAIDDYSELTIIIDIEGTVTAWFETGVCSPKGESKTEKAFETEPTMKNIHEFVTDCMKTK